ncbi:helix-turn-helix domain-containing protein [Virgibacillus salexigens]|uniref:Helix-turn-helix domain-containing protein n=1 Tax=Virgibacillus massiliensis TaxID=1462526 RepID=A0A024QJJ4_9BACI|nr:helix-turn-helix domain-containing protein [Virgibacillus massiliensis]CDQ42116.1 hypothetical protein BN990_04496 [Virgibacillus massiliensis]
MDTVIQFRGTIYENGYGLIAQKVMRDRDLSPQAKSIYAYICSFAGVGKDGERTAFPGVELMMKELGIKSEKTYYKHRKQLINKGYITIEKRKDKGKFDNNLYFIEAVPHPKEEKQPTSKKYSTEKTNPQNLPDGKKSSLQNESGKKLRTNSNRVSSLTGFKEEEENKENLFMSELDKFLQGKNIDKETINEIKTTMYNQGVTEFNMDDVLSQYEHMMKKLEYDTIFDFASYFVGGLKRKTSQTKAKRQYSDQKAQEKKLEDAERENRVSVLEFNWLEA